MRKVYISGPLTGVEHQTQLKAFYEAIGSVCEELKLQSYVPHMVTDPTNNPDIPPDVVFQTDKHQIKLANLVIAYVGLPSLGVGMELAYAEMACIPIILLYEKGKIISRFPRGIPTIISELQFSSYEDALEQLRNVLSGWTSSN
ncbi:MAG TPA: XRE family transcriptional regulator [Allocoleopsis sp.]